MLFKAHSQLPPGLGGQAVLLALQGAHVADVSSGCSAVVPQHLVVVLPASPILEVTQGFDQGVS